MHARCILIFPPVFDTVTFYCRDMYCESGGLEEAAGGGRCADAIYGHTTDSALLLAAGLMQLLVNKMAFLLLPF